MADNSQLGGFMIYLIENTLTNDKYVGYTSKSKEARFKRHKHNALKGGNTYLYKAMRKYGFENFVITVLDEHGSYFDEVQWISKLNPEYNMTNGGEGGDTSNSPNFKKSMIDYHFVKPKEEYATFGMLGKIHKAETIEKQSKTQKENWASLTEEEKKERGEKIKGEKNGMFGKTPKNSIQVEVNGIRYNSKTDACRKIGKSWYYIQKHYEVKIERA